MQLIPALLLAAALPAATFVALDMASAATPDDSRPSMNSTAGPATASTASVAPGRRCCRKASAASNRPRPRR